MTSKLTGQRFGRLVAIKDIGSESNARVWEFLCDCGQTKTAKAIAVKFGNVRSCGCLASQNSSERKRSKLFGNIFGRLTVIECVGPNRFGAVVWACKCSCGNQCTATSTALLTGKKRSCGCLRSELAAKRQKAKKLPSDVKANNLKNSAAKQREIRKSNPVAVMHARLSRLHRHAIRQVGGIKSSPTFEMLGYSVHEFISHLERQFVKGMSWENMSEWQIDHIVPVKEAKTEADVIALNQLSNLRPMWAKENNAKKAKRTSLL